MKPPEPRMNRRELIKKGSLLLAGALVFPTSGWARKKCGALSIERFSGTREALYSTSVLIHRNGKGFLVDGQFHRPGARQLAQQIKAAGIALDFVYITHAHPDHYFGLEVLRQEFPNTSFYAHPLVVAEIEETLEEEIGQLRKHYGELVAEDVPIPLPLDRDELNFDGSLVRLVSLQPGEASHSVAVHVPEEFALITGDASYNQVHPWLEAVPLPRIHAWIRNLSLLKSLRPNVVISGHCAPNTISSPQTLCETEAYLKNFIQLLETGDKAHARAFLTRRYAHYDLTEILDLSLSYHF